MTAHALTSGNLTAGWYRASCSSRSPQRCRASHSGSATHSHTRPDQRCRLTSMWPRCGLETPYAPRLTRPKKKKRPVSRAFRWWALEDLNLRPLPCQGRYGQPADQYFRSSARIRAVSWVPLSTVCFGRLLDLVLTDVPSRLWPSVSEETQSVTVSVHGISCRGGRPRGAEGPCPSRGPRDRWGPSPSQAPSTTQERYTGRNPPIPVTPE